MKYIIPLIAFLISLNCVAQNFNVKSDTLLKKEHVSLSLDNGLSIPPFGVSGDFYLTNDQLIFHPKPFRRKRFEMYNDLVKDVKLPYDSIVVAKRRGILGLKIKTETKKYRFDGGNMRLRTTIALINRLVDEHKKVSLTSNR